MTSTNPPPLDLSHLPQLTVFCVSSIKRFEGPTYVLRLDNDVDVQMPNRFNRDLHDGILRPHLRFLVRSPTGGADGANFTFFRPSRYGCVCRIRRILLGQSSNVTDVAVKTTECPCEAEHRVAKQRGQDVGEEESAGSLNYCECLKKTGFVASYENYVTNVTEYLLFRRIIKSYELPVTVCVGGRQSLKRKRVTVEEDDDEQNSEIGSILRDVASFSFSNFAPRSGSTTLARIRKTQPKRKILRKILPSGSTSSQNSSSTNSRSSSTDSLTTHIDDKEN